MALGSRVLIITNTGAVLRFTDPAAAVWGDTGLAPTAEDLKDCWGRLALLKAEGGAVSVRHFVNPVPAPGVDPPRYNYDPPADITAATADYAIEDGTGINLSELPGAQAGEVHVFSLWFCKATAGAILRVTFQQEHATK